MPRERSVGPRDALLTVALFGVVVACGAGGIYISKQTSHAAVPSPQPPPAAAQPTAKHAAPFALDRPAAEPASLPAAQAPSLPAAQDRAARAAAASAPAASGDVTVPDAASASAVSPAAEDTVADTTPGQITDDKEVSLALGRWQKAMLSNDSAEIAPSYAPHVNRFFLKTQVSRDFVRDYLERDEERGTRLTRYDMEDVTMRHLKPNEVEVDYRANFVVSTPDKDRTGDAHTTLILKRLEGDWKIVYERDFKG